jgi:hypothetical protein
VYLGSAAGLTAAASWRVEGNSHEANFGHAVATAGDVNGDGYADVIVGAPYQGHGRATVYHGSPWGLSGIPAWTVDGSPQADWFGFSVSAAGDVDGDGYADVIVSAVRNDIALLYRGSPFGLSSTPAWIGTGTLGDFFGSSVSTAGDVNGDGYGDVIVGAPYARVTHSSEGRAFVYYGGGDGNLDRNLRQMRTDGVMPIVLGLKSDAETAFRLRARGITPAGRGKIRLEWEVEPLGSPFDGAGIAFSTVRDTGAPTVSGSAVSIDPSITGLFEGTFYHWRARITSSDPFFPRSPWRSVPGNNVTETKLRTAGCVDSDGDGYGDRSWDPSCASLVADCDPHEDSLWATPGPTRNLRFTSLYALAWDPPTSPGGILAATRYDVLRSAVRDDFLVGICIETNDGPNMTSAVEDEPPAGSVFYYLTRARNGCPQGVGSLGTTSAGAERAGRSCP